MHESSYNEMRQFVERYLDPERELSILDVGSLDVNGSYRPLFDNPRWKYLGLDVVDGPNVDIVAGSPDGIPFVDNTFDVVISGSVLEHVEDTHVFIREAARVTKPAGIMCHVAPWTYPEHKYPVDCWRIMPDGMRFLLEKIAGLNVLDVHKNDTDCVGIAGTPQRDSLKIAFGCLVNDPMRLDMVLRMSKLDPFTLHVMFNPDTACRGLNRLLTIMEEKGNDIAVLTHQDMYFTSPWIRQVHEQIAALPESWIVAGIIGKDMDGNLCGRVHDMRMPTYFLTDHEFPVPASCFDECCIIVNLKKGFRFDEDMSGFDLYGTQAACIAWEMGGPDTAFMINAFAEHYCTRSFDWTPGEDFENCFRWIHERFPRASRIDSTVLGIPAKNEEPNPARYDGEF